MAEDLVLDNNQFLIYNKMYPHAKLTLLKDLSVGTTELALAPEQLWTFKPSENIKGCYYIINEAHPELRLADWKNKLIAYDDKHYGDQVFKLVPSGNDDEHFYIYSQCYEEDRIAKYDRDDEQTGMYSGPLYSGQLWKLVPRFKVNFHTNVVFHFDNRQNPEPIKREVTVTRGVKRGSDSSIRNMKTFTQSIDASLNAAFNLFNIGLSSNSKTEFSDEIALQFAKKTEEEWSKVEKITFTIPANKNFKVMQHVVKFDGEFEVDSCTLLTDIKVLVSDKNEFDDPDNFILKTQ